MVQCGEGHGVVWCGVAWRGVAWCGVGWSVRWPQAHRAKPHFLTEICCWGQASLPQKTVNNKLAAFYSAALVAS
eukprot:12894067-Prorocentrum_lima.AAC.1